MKSFPYSKFFITRFAVCRNENPPNSQSPLWRPVLLNAGLLESSDSVLFRSCPKLSQAFVVVLDCSFERSSWEVYLTKSFDFDCETGESGENDPSVELGEPSGGL